MRANLINENHCPHTRLFIMMDGQNDCLTHYYGTPRTFGTTCPSACALTRTHTPSLPSALAIHTQTQNVHTPYERTRLHTFADFPFFMMGGQIDCLTHYYGTPRTFEHDLP